MKVLLHIGQSKTGTSAIQAFLSLNREPLKEAGVLYPAIKVNGLPLDIAHNAVADSLVGKLRFPYLSAEEYFSQFFEEAEKMNAKMLILSAEHFFAGEPRVWTVSNQKEYFGLYRNKIEKLGEFLNGHDVELLVYLRPQLDWLSSAVSQTVRIEGLMGDRTIYQNDHQFYELMKPLLMYTILLDIWVDTINPTALKVVPYIKSKLFKNSSIADFLHRTGLENIHFPYANVDVQVNKSLTREYIEVKKILNKSPRGKNTERVIIKCLENLSELSREGTIYNLDNKVRREVFRFSEIENNKLIKKYDIDESFLMREEIADEINPKTVVDVEAAMLSFKREYRKLRYRILWLNYAARSFLREYGKPVHAVLHQIKMTYHKKRFRNL